MEHAGDNYTNFNWCVGTVTKRLLKGLEDLEVGGKKLLYYWERPEYWEESWKFEETCCHSNFSERPSANAEVKKTLIIIIIKDQVYQSKNR